MRTGGGVHRFDDGIALHHSIHPVDGCHGLLFASFTAASQNTKQSRLLNSICAEEGVVYAFWKKNRVFALQWDQSRAIMSVEGVKWGKKPLFCPQCSAF
jgi:hypothetical protein